MKMLRHAYHSMHQESLQKTAKECRHGTPGSQQNQRDRTHAHFAGAMQTCEYPPQQFRKGLNLIVAMSKNRCIGFKGALPWRISQDLRHFRARTWGHPVIMGRRTFESIGKPLPGRQNFVLTRRNLQLPTTVIPCYDFEKALRQAQKVAGGENIFVIGGAQIYKQALPFAHRIYLTKIAQNFAGDTFFPEFCEQQWRTLDCSEWKGENPAYRFMILENSTCL